MAQLQLKKRYANPLIVAFLSNNSFARHLTQHNLTKDAYCTTRNIIFQARLKSGFDKSKLETINPPQLQNIPHLQFADRDAGFNDRVLEYNHFVTYLSHPFKHHFQPKSKIPQESLTRLYQNITNAHLSELNFLHPLNLFNRATFDHFTI